MTPQTTAAEDSGSHGIVDSYNSNGITVSNGTNSTYPRLYYNRNNPFGGSDGGKYVYHYWKANAGTTSSNTDGDITSTVQVDQTSGCSIMTWSGSGNSGDTIGHGLGAVPKMTIIKQRNASNGWNVWHAANNNGDVDSFGELNGAASWYQNQGANGPYTASPTSSVLTLTAYGQVNSSSGTYLGYCFSEIKGYSKFSKYTGNGNVDGPCVNLGFKPNFILIKSASAGEHWNIPIFESDANGTVNTLSTNLANGERTMDQNPAIDYLSNGFKIRTSDANYNTNNGTYLYAAFAKYPFVSSTGTPVTAR